MKFKNKIFSLTVVFAVSSLAMNVVSAEVVGGVTYHNAEVEGVRLGLVSATVGHKFGASSSNFSLTPEFRVGTGIRDDEFSGVKVKAKTFYGLNVRAQWDLASGTYLFVAPSYTNLEAEASFGGAKVTDDSWEFGGGAGVGFKMSDNLGLEVSYEDFDGFEIIGLGARFSF